MPLIVAPAAGADSFCSVDQADVYHANRGNTTWAAASLSAKEIALRKATDYIEGRYSGLWRGHPATPDQTLSWPRIGVSPRGYLLTMGVPTGVANACAEAAFRALTASLYRDVESSTVTSEKVGPIAVTYATRSDGQTTYPAIDDMLAPYLMASRGQIVLTRA